MNFFAHVLFANIISKNKDASKEGVVVGRNAVIGACTLVNCDVPEGATAVGVPCRIIERPTEVDTATETEEARNG